MDGPSGLSYNTALTSISGILKILCALMHIVFLKDHVHNVSAYSRRSVNAPGVVNFASTVCTYDPGQSTVPW